MGCVCAYLKACQASDGGWGMAEHGQVLQFLCCVTFARLDNPAKCTLHRYHGFWELPWCPTGQLSMQGVSLHAYQHSCNVLTSHETLHVSFCCSRGYSQLAS